MFGRIAVGEKCTAMIDGEYNTPDAGTGQPSVHPMLIWVLREARLPGHEAIGQGLPCHEARRILDCTVGTLVAEERPEVLKEL